MKTNATTPLFILLLTVSLLSGKYMATAQPINDHIQNAIDLDQQSIPFTDISVDFEDITAQGDQTGLANCDIMNPGIWYKFTAKTAGNVSTNIVNSGNSPWLVYFTAPDENVTDATELTYYDVPGNSCGLGSFRAVDVLPDVTYYIYIKDSWTRDITFNIEAALVPSNDLLSNATDLGYYDETFGEQSVHFDLATATDDATTGSGCNLSQAGIWYKFTATKEGNVAAGVLSPDNAYVVFFSGPENATSGNQLQYVDQNTNNCDVGPISEIDTETDTTYYIYMRNESTSNVLINAVDAFSAPENDLVENATDINGFQNYSDENVHTLFSTVNNDNGQIGCDSGGSALVWYKFTAINDGEVSATISSDPSQSALVFYSAANENVTLGSELTHVNQASNPCDAGTGSSIQAEAGQTYYVAAGSGDPYLSFEINLGQVLDVTSTTLEGFSFHPNPVSNSLHLSAKNNIDEIVVYNMLGQQVYAERVATRQKSIDFSTLRTGMYVMHITSEGKSKTYKITKN